LIQLKTIRAARKLYFAGGIKERPNVWSACPTITFSVLILLCSCPGLSPWISHVSPLTQVTNFLILRVKRFCNHVLECLNNEPEKSLREFPDSCGSLDPFEE